jgi:L-ascorbate metabolism protein UlaG (beta-lactamase superfamily)
MLSKWRVTFLALNALWVSACLPKLILTQPGDPDVGVQVTWNGHSCFTLKDSVGRTVVIDPFDDTVGYGRLSVKADALLITHEHFDHNEKRAVRSRGRDLELVNSTGVISAAGGLSVMGVASDHDKEAGQINGSNRMFSFMMGGLRFVHLGDLGQGTLSSAQVAALGQVDVLFVPVGGTVTIDARQAKAVVDQLKPKFVFPMHFGDIRFYKLAPVEDFLKHFSESQIVTSTDSSVQLRLAESGSTLKVFVLPPKARDY